MRSTFRLFRCAGVSLVLVTACVFPVTGQDPDSSATCATGTAEAFLDVGNVRAKILNNGGLFWNGGANVYEVPKGGGENSISAASLWIGGMVNEELRVAATTYGPWEFWPGPVSGLSPETCDEHDRIWGLTIDDLRRDGPVADWPVDAGAPFVDVDGDGKYEPSNGDRPELLGDQQLWWVMNDAGAPHPTTQSNPLGIEVRSTAFAFGEKGAVENSTFYRYLIRNTSQRIIVGAYAGLYFDTDLGAAFDDYVGSDSLLGLGYTYNGDNNDDGAYGEAPPALGATVLKRPRSAVMMGGAACRYPDGPSVGLTSMLYYNGGGGVTSDPNRTSDFYNNLQGRWKDGSLVTQGGYGYHEWNGSSDSTRFAYPGDPVTGAYWSEVNTDGSGATQPPADRRWTTGLGPFCMAPGEEVEVVFAIVWSRGSSNLDSVRKLKEDVAYIQSIRDVILTPRPLPAQDVSIPDVPFAVGVYPNPAGVEGVTVRLSLPERMGVRVEVYDLLGRRVHIAARTDILGAGDHQWSVPTGAWAPGVYLVRIQAGPAVTTRRLIVPN